MSIFRWLFPPETDAGDTNASIEPPADEHAYDATFEPPAEAEPVPLPTTQELMTGTATIVIYDLEALAHRLDDEIDWWADAEPELEELRKRNLLILGVQADGFYDVEVKEGEADYPISFSLRVPSGKVFIGPGEEITGGEQQPDGNHGGFFVSLEPGDYTVAVRRVDDERISLAFNRGAAFENQVSEPVRI